MASLNDGTDDSLHIGSGFFTCDDFIGDFDFFGPAISKDCERLVSGKRLAQIPVLKKPKPQGKPQGKPDNNENENEKLLGDDDESILGGGFGKIAWVEEKELQAQYATVSEVIRNLKQLPLELNSLATDELEAENGRIAKVDSAESARELMLLKLSKVMGNSTSVTFMGRGDRQPLRLDSSGEEDDVGHAVTCLYFVSVPEDIKGGELKLVNVSDRTERIIEPKTDRLVVWRSKDVENERMVVEGGEGGIFAVNLWFHGCITTIEAVHQAVSNIARASAEAEAEAAVLQQPNKTNI